MIEKRPGVFSELFESDSFYNKVEKRKKRLVDRLINTRSPEFPFTLVFPMKGSTDALLDFMKKIVQKNHDITFTEDPPGISFFVNNGKQVSCDYLCVEYARLYHVSPDQTAIRRYTYFEIYFDDNILSCLMDLPTFQKVSSFPSLDMDTQEWAHLKQQLKLWNQFIYPDLEEMEAANAIPDALASRLQAYRKFKNNNHYKELEHGLSYPKENENFLWPVATYLSLLQLLPILPEELIPSYALNFVCQDVHAKNLFAQKIKLFLNEFCNRDPVILGNVQIISTVENADETGRTFGAAWPYISIITRGKARQLVQSINQFAVSEKKSWRNHPFLNDVPIFISTEQIEDSTVLNLTISSDTAKQFTTDTISSDGFWYFFANLMEDLDKNELPDQNELSKQFQKLKKKLLTSPIDKNAIKYQTILFPLAVSFIMLYGNEPGNYKLPKNAVNWFSMQALEWKKQNLAFEEFFPRVLKSVAADIITAKKEKPSDESEFQNLFHGVFCFGEEFLCYHLEAFKQKIAEEFPFVDYCQLLERLSEGKILKTNKNDLNYSLKLKDRTTVRTIAFLLDKLPPINN